MNYEQQLRDFKYRGTVIPLHMRDGIDRYLSRGVRPGNFLQAIIRKDLVGAMNHADDINIWLIPVYYSFFYSHAPSEAWGSQERMECWIVKHNVPR